MIENLKISLVQYDPAWEDKNSNMQKIRHMMQDVPENTHLVVFPEMFLSGFSMNTRVTAETMQGSMVQWMHEMAAETGFSLMGSLPIVSNNKCFNRLLLVSPEGVTDWYDKRHLFRMGEEEQLFSRGTEKKVFTIEGWHLLPQVCYDLRFPVWSRNTGLEYDVAVYVSNWPEPRIDAFLSLLKARAVENMSYVIGLNRTGTDGNELKYNGQSVVYDAKGGYVSAPAGDSENVISFTLYAEPLLNLRKKFPAYLDADEFEIKK